MTLTPHSTLRVRLLTHLNSVGGSQQRAVLLNAIDELYSSEWTTEDLLPQTTRQFETKWRNRMSFERQRLVEQGLLEARRDGLWSMTPAGHDALANVDLEKASWVAGESLRREEIWSRLNEEGAVDEVLPASLRAHRLYAGQLGIYVDVPETRSRWAPSGVALSFVDLGSRYPNELSEGGVLYHFPATEAAGRDRAEIAATEAAYRLGVPVFVIARSKRDDTRRVVHRAIVEDIDSSAQTALITFTGGNELPPAPLAEGDRPFDLLTEDQASRLTLRRSRPHQARFAFGVFRRYGAQCAVCDVNVPEVLEAAHLRPKARQGSDDERNGLPLCSNHHRMLDSHLWAVNPDGLQIEYSSGYDPAQLGIQRAGLEHLRRLPHTLALEDAWRSWQKIGAN